MRNANFLLVESLLAEANLSYQEQQAAVGRALRSSDYNPDGVFRFVVAMYEAEVVFAEWTDDDGYRYFKASYTIDEAGTALLGDGVEVRQVITFEPVAVQESEKPTQSFIEGSYVALESGIVKESAFAESGKIKVKVITPGWGSSGYYSKEMLKRDCAKAWPAGTKMFWNHPTLEERKNQPERDCDKISATLLTAATWEENGPEGPGPYAEAQVKTYYREKVKELKEDIGVSIYTDGRREPGEAEGRKGLIVTDLFENIQNTIDFVTYPGAGGEIVQLFESARPQPQGHQENEDMKPEDIAALEATNTNLTSANAALVAENAKLKAFPAARLAAVESLGQFTDMPAITRERVATECASAPILAESGELDTEKFTAFVKESGEAAMGYLKEAGLNVSTSTPKPKPAVHGNGGGAPVKEAGNVAGNVIRGTLGLI